MKGINDLNFAKIWKAVNHVLLFVKSIQDANIARFLTSFKSQISTKHNDNSSANEA